MSDFLKDELLLEMEKNLKQSSSENNSLKLASEYLQTASTIFSNNGLLKQANQIQNLLAKLASSNKSVLTLSELMKAGISQRDLKEFEKNNSLAIAKVNLALYSLGYSTQEVIQFLGDKSLSENNAFNTVSSHGENVFKIANNVEKQEKQDWHIKNLTPQKQVENLKDHGTQFNMANDCAIELPPKKDVLEPEDMDPDFADMLKSFDFNSVEDEEEPMLFEDEKD